MSEKSKRRAEQMAADVIDLIDGAIAVVREEQRQEHAALRQELAAVKKELLDLLATEAAATMVTP